MDPPTKNDYFTISLFNLLIVGAFIFQDTLQSVLGSNVYQSIFITTEVFGFQLSFLGSAFMHNSYSHLLFNSAVITLSFLVLSTRFHWLELISIMFVSILGSTVGYTVYTLLFTPVESFTVVGASGAAFGLASIIGVLLVEKHTLTEYLYVGGIWIVIVSSDLILVYLPVIGDGSVRVAVAHSAGAVCSLLLVILIIQQQNRF